MQRHLPLSGWHTSGVTPSRLQLQGRHSGKRKYPAAQRSHRRPSTRGLQLHKSQAASFRTRGHLHTLTSCHTPALSREAVAVGPRDVFDSGRRAFAAVAAQQGVVAEGLGLAHVAGGLHRLRGADAFSCHLVAQAAAALARCRGERGGIWRDVHKQTAGGGGGAWLTSAVGEAVESRSTLCAPAPDDVLSAGALSPSWIAARARRPGSVTVAGQSAVVVGRSERAGGLSAGRRRRVGAEGK